MTEPVESDTVYYIKTDAPINKDSVKEDDGTYLTPQNKIAPSSQDETGSKNKTGDKKENEDVQSDRIIIKLKCAVVVLMVIVLFALMALAVHLAFSHPHNTQPTVVTPQEPVTSSLTPQEPVTSEIETKNVTVQSGNGFHLTHTSSMKITYCSVNTPFNEEESVKRTDDRNADDASRILIHDEQDESHDIISADKGRLHLIITDNLCQITVSNAMKKDNGRWNLYVGVGRGFFERKNIIYEVSVSGDDVTEEYESKGTSSHPTSSIKDVTIKQASENTMTKLVTYAATEKLTPTMFSNRSSTLQGNAGKLNSTKNNSQTTISI